MQSIESNEIKYKRLIEEQFQVGSSSELSELAADCIARGTVEVIAFTRI